MQAPLFVLLAALLLYFLRFGYDYGISDQDDIIPYLLHRLHPERFTRDWFVQGQAAAFGVRTYPVLLLQALSVALPIWLAFLGLYVAAWLLTAGAVFSIAYTLTRHRLAAAAAVVVALVLTPQWTLGGNDMAHSILAPSMGGWALGLWGLVFWLRDQPVKAGLLIGLATWMQPLVGLQLAGLLGVTLLWATARREVPARTLVLFGAAFMLAALPALVPLFYEQLAGTTPTGADDTPGMFYIMALFRNPHHYLFFSFPTRSLVRFGGLVVLGTLSFVWLRRKQALHHPAFVIRLAIGITAFCLVGFLCTEVVPVLAVAQLQLFKTTVLAKLICVILICSAFFAVMPASFTRHLDRWLHHERAWLAAVLVLWALVGLGIVLDAGPVRARVGPFAHAATPVAQVETWARTQTPLDAVFATPPSWSGFRSRAHRAIVINFKSFPYREALNRVWFERLTQTAPIPLPHRATPALQDSLDDAFRAQSADALLHLAGRYEVDYIVRDQAFSPLPSLLEEVFTADPWIVYRILPADRSRE